MAEGFFATIGKLFASTEQAQRGADLTGKPAAQVAAGQNANPAKAAARPTPKPVSNATFKQTLVKNTEQNPLNAYFNPTYHFRFFAAGDKDLITSKGGVNNISDLLRKVNSQIDKVIIAESGVTGYNIKEVQIETKVAQTAETRQQKGTHITMTITEPMGISFLDGLAGATSMLGVWDYTKSIYFLELWFDGYDENGVAKTPIPIAGSKNGGHWLWALKLANIETKINETGSQYTLTCITIDSESLYVESKTFSAKKAISVKGKTVGELLDAYADALTVAWAEEQGKDAQNRSLINFKIDANQIIHFGPSQGKKPADFQLKPQNKELSSVRIAQSGDSYEMIIPRGTNVNDVIATVIISTEQGQSVILDQPKVQSDEPQKKYRTSVLFSVEPVIETIKWDKTTRNYQKNVTFHVMPTYSQTSVLTNKELEDAKEPSVQRQRIMEISNLGFLRKQYDYLFTGLNTEIIDFNIDFNFKWSAVLPRQAGTNQSYQTEATQQRKNQNPPDVSIPPLQPVALRDATIGNPENLPPQANALRVIPVAQQTAISSTQENLPQQANAFARTRPVSAPQTGQTFYIEDVLTQLNQGRNVGDIMPISYTTALYDVEREQGIGSQGQYHRDQSIAAAIIAQKFYGTFMKLEMTIRGDPYWLGQSNLERQIALGRKDDAFDLTGLPDYTSGSPAFILNLKYPVQIGDNFRPIIKTSDAFSGIYETTNIKHTFSDGSFKQVVSANRMTQLDLMMANTADPGTRNNDTASRATAENNPSGAQGNPNSGQTPGTGSARIAPSGVLPNSATQQQLATESYNFWTSKGYSSAAASGMVAQEEAESHFGSDPTTNANPSIQQGNFQWSPTRAAAILAGTGIDVSSSSTTHEQQLAAAYWEQTQGSERSAGRAIQAAATGGDAGTIATLKYERPKALQQQATIRGGRGQFWQNHFTQSVSTAANTGDTNIT